MKLSLLLLLFSFLVFAGKEETEAQRLVYTVQAQVFEIDPYQIGFYKSEGKPQQKISLLTLNNKKLACFQTLFFESNTWGTFAEMVAQAIRTKKSLVFATEYLIERGDKYLINANNFSSVWQISDNPIDLQWQSMTAEKFRSKYTRTEGSACWLFSQCDPQITKYNFSGYYRDVGVFSESWQDLLLHIETLEPNDTVLISKYITKFSLSDTQYAKIPGDQVFSIGASSNKE